MWLKSTIIKNIAYIKDNAPKINKGYNDSSQLIIIKLSIFKNINNKVITTVNLKIPIIYKNNMLLKYYNIILSNRFLSKKIPAN